MAKKNKALAKNPVVSMKQELQDTIDALHEKHKHGVAVASQLSDSSYEWKSCVDEAEDFLKYTKDEDAILALNVLRAQAQEFLDTHKETHEQVVQNNTEISNVITACSQKIADFALMEAKAELNESLREISANLKNPIAITASVTELRDAKQLVYTAQAFLELQDNKL